MERMILSSTLDWLSLQHRIELGTWVKAKLLRLHQVQPGKTLASKGCWMQHHSLGLGL